MCIMCVNVCSTIYTDNVLYVYIYMYTIHCVYVYGGIYTQTFVYIRIYSQIGGDEATYTVNICQFVGQHVKTTK